MPYRASRGRAGLSRIGVSVHSSRAGSRGVVGGATRQLHFPAWRHKSLDASSEEITFPYSYRKGAR